MIHQLVKHERSIKRNLQNQVILKVIISTHPWIIFLLKKESELEIVCVNISGSRISHGYIMMKGQNFFSIAENQLLNFCLLKSEKRIKITVTLIYRSGLIHFIFLLSLICFIQNQLCLEKERNLKDQRNKEDAYVIKGFSPWRKASKCFKFQQDSACHRAASFYQLIVLKCQDLEELKDNQLSKRRGIERSILQK